MMRRRYGFSCILRPQVAPVEPAPGLGELMERREAQGVPPAQSLTFSRAAMAPQPDEGFSPCAIA